MAGLSTPQSTLPAQTIQPVSLTRILMVFTIKTYII